ncbi:phosphohistidine phosphatase SixA [Magnetovibrio sp.]|uniref:phosphohistidine phosphatase SixA n=1 Tax=Magnetovibrio sp. TaxID=2024836 RepID=UPI002F921A33
MKLYLVQHAEALPKETDSKRPLSEKGRNDAAKIAAFLLIADVRVDEVVHSGKARAEQTANILSKDVWSGQAAVEIEGLGPNDSTDHLMHSAEISGGDLMVVGHMPFMAKMAARCLTGSENGMAVAFEPGTVVCLERIDDSETSGGWALNWMQRPSMLGEHKEV